MPTSLTTLIAAGQRIDRARPDRTPAITRWRFTGPRVRGRGRPRTASECATFPRRAAGGSRADGRHDRAHRFFGGPCRPFRIEPKGAARWWAKHRSRSLAGRFLDYLPRSLPHLRRRSGGPGESFLGIRSLQNEQRGGYAPFVSVGRCVDNLAVENHRAVRTDGGSGVRLGGYDPSDPFPRPRRGPPITSSTARS